MVKRIKSSWFQGSVGLPGRGHTQDVAAADIPVAVDDQRAGIEVANVDPVAARIHIRTTDIDALEEALPCREIMAITV
jgi:hypothetical protein